MAIESPGTAPRGEAFFDVTSFNGSLPGTVDIADVADANLAGLRVFLEAWQDGEVEGDFASHEVRQRLTTTPTAFTVDFEDTPVISSPMSGANLTVAQARMMTISFAQVTGGLTGGLGLVQIESENPGLSVDRTAWLILLPRSRSSLTLPPTVAPMFGPNGYYGLSVEVVTTTGAPLDFDATFNGNVAANLAAVVEWDTEYLSRHERTFTTE